MLTTVKIVHVSKNYTLEEKKHIDVYITVLDSHTLFVRGQSRELAIFIYIYLYLCISKQTPSTYLNIVLMFNILQLRNSWWTSNITKTLFLHDRKYIWHFCSAISAYWQAYTHTNTSTSQYLDICLADLLFQLCQKGRLITTHA